MLNVILETCAGTLTQGLIYAILSYGIFITYKILDFPDLTVDGSFPLGAAVTAVLLTHGVNAWLTLPISLLIGALAGLCTGLIHVRARVRGSACRYYHHDGAVLYQSADRRRQPDGGAGSGYHLHLGAGDGTAGRRAALYRKLIVSLVLVVLIGLLLEWYFSTKNGLLLRAVGDNETLVTALAVDKGSMKILGLVMRQCVGGAFRLHRLSGGTLLQRHDGHRSNGIRPGCGYHRHHAVPPRKLCKRYGGCCHRQHSV